MSKTEPTPARRRAQALDLTGESDYDLLTMMTWRESDPAEAREAGAVFYRRHAPYLYDRCLKFTRGSGGGTDAEDIVAVTFQHVYEKGARTFKATSETDPDRIRGHVRAWLGRIAHNLVCDAYRGRPFQEMQLDDDSEVADEHDDKTASDEPERLQRLMEQVLTDREQEILRVTSLYYDPREPDRKLPASVLDDLARHWGITRENIRQIKSRALRKLKDACAVHTDAPSSQAKEAR